MIIPTEPIGGIPRPRSLLEAIEARGDGTDPGLDGLFEEATRETIEQFEATGGTTDDCGFAPFCDDTSTSREKAFAKFRSRVLGTALAADALGVH